MKAVSFLLWGGIFAIALNLSACTPTPPTASVGGTLDVLGPDISFTEAIAEGKLPDVWLWDGGKGQLDIEQVDSLPAVRISPGGDSYAFMRRVKAPLIAMPYLSWAWRAESPKNGAHPVRIIAGLTDTSRKPNGKWWQVTAPSAPKVSRLISIIWDENALSRGTLIGPHPAGDGVEHVIYVARGGQEQDGRWWVDTVDLAQIHRQAWPRDNPKAIEVQRVGIAVKSGDPKSAMHVATIRLTR